MAKPDKLTTRDQSLALQAIYIMNARYPITQKVRGLVRYEALRKTGLYKSTFDSLTRWDWIEEKRHGVKLTPDGLWAMENSGWARETMVEAYAKAADAAWKLTPPYLKRAKKEKRGNLCNI